MADAAEGSSRHIPEAIIFPFNIPTISAGSALSAGFNFLFQDRSGTLTVQQLGEHYPPVSRRGATSGRNSANLFTSFDPNYPQVKVDLDREKARKLGVPVNEVFQALSRQHGRQPM